MPKEDTIELDGVVTEIVPNAQFRVQLDNDQLISSTRPERCARTASEPWWATESRSRSRLMI
jgi:hypothetical protein